jgi:shikimate kinase
MHIVLLGLMGSGKTSIGKRVAERLGRPLIDGDVVLEDRTGGRTAADLADEAGIDALHELEAEIAIEALATPEPAVIGPAASVLEVDDALAALDGHTVVWFTAPASYLAERAVQKSHRPLLAEGDPAELFERQLAVREPRALPLADLVIDVSTTSKEDAADAIVALVSRAAPPSSPAPSSPAPSSPPPS